MTYVVNRNINFTNVCYTGCRFCAFAQRRTDADAYTLSLDEVGDRAEEAWAAGATEVCMQGGIHPDLPGTALLRPRRRGEAAPARHARARVLPDGGDERRRAHRRVGPGVADAGKEAGVDSIPGTAAEILDDDVRWVLTKGKLPAADVDRGHHAPRTSSACRPRTMMYGHVDAPAHWVGAPAGAPAIQDGPAASPSSCRCRSCTRTRRSTWPAWPGPARRGGRTARCTRWRGCCCTGAIDPIQTSWVKLGDEGCRDVLRGGANDLGGTLMEETISRMAGSEHGSYKTIVELRAIAEPLGRPMRQRTTTYGDFGNVLLQDAHYVPINRVPIPPLSTMGLKRFAAFVGVIPTVLRILILIFLSIVTSAMKLYTFTN